jgi:acyl dehydratase
MAAARHPDLGADLRRLLHAREEHLLHEAIGAGDRLEVRSVIESIDDHPAGETFTVRAIESAPDGRTVAEVIGTMLIRGPGRAERRESPPAPGTVVFEDSVEVAPDQMERYAQASGDSNPIHLDRAAARRAGLRAPILHGMCTMAMALRGAVNGLAEGDPTRVRRALVTFSRPVVPGRTLTTRYWELGGEGDLTSYGFTTTDDGGAEVIERGEVGISR